MRKPVIGIVGGVGAGKSAVAGILQSLGCAVIDSDQMVHEQYRNPAVVTALREWWGDSVIKPDGSPDRAAIARIVFSSPAELQRLEGFLYPRLEELRRRQMVTLEADPAVKAIVLDAPKLLEVGLDRQCDVIIFVHAEEDVRASRVAKSRGWSRDELVRREKMQIPLDKKRARADYTVENSSSEDALRPHVERIFRAVIAGHSPKKTM